GSALDGSELARSARCAAGGGSFGDTPSAGMSDQAEFARNCQRRRVGPRCAVQGNPARGTNRDRPGRGHPRTETSTPKCCRRLETSRCRAFGTPGAEADADRVTVLDHRQHRRATRANLAQLPAAEVALKVPFVVDLHYAQRRW